MYPYPHNASVKAAVLALRTTSNFTLGELAMVMAIAHAHATRRVSGFSLLDKLHERISNSIRNNRFRRVFDAILTRHTRYALGSIIYFRGIISNQIVDAFLSLFFQKFLLFFLSCFVCRISCTITPSHYTPPSHPILHRPLSPPDSEGHAYIYPVRHYPFDPLS